MVSNRFWPSGRILNNAGTRQGQLASCFVLPLEDDFDSIFDSLSVAARCHRTGGGTGFDFSKMREKGAYISSSEAAGASGAVSWIHLIDAETSTVMCGGKMRGANLGSLSVYHPDIDEFIRAKSDCVSLPNFNLSVSVDDAFMRAVQNDDHIDLTSQLDGQPTESLPATWIWKTLVQHAWATGDPGLLFIDNINRQNPLLGYLGPITTTNPCAEQTMYPFESSNLGSLNLEAFYRSPTNDVNWDDMREVIGYPLKPGQLGVGRVI